MPALLTVAGGVPGVHAALMLQGCGHFALEAAIRSLVPHGGRMLIPATGAYAARAGRLARAVGCDIVTMPVEQGQGRQSRRSRGGLARRPGD